MSILIWIGILVLFVCIARLTNRENPVSDTTFVRVFAAIAFIVFAIWAVIVAWVISVIVGL